MVPLPAKKSRIVELGNVMIVVDSKNFINPDGLGNAKGLPCKISANSAVPCAVLNKSEVIRFLYGVVLSTG